MRSAPASFCVCQRSARIVLAEAWRSSAVVLLAQYDSTAFLISPGDESESGKGKIRGGQATETATGGDEQRRQRRLTVGTW